MSLYQVFLSGGPGITFYYQRTAPTNSSKKHAHKQQNITANKEKIVKSVRKWLFTPEKLGVQPISMEVPVPVHFSIQ